MTALGLVNTLRAKTRTVDPALLKDDDYAWGTYKVSDTAVPRCELRVLLYASEIIECSHLLGSFGRFDSTACVVEYSYDKQERCDDPPDPRNHYVSAF